MPPTSMLVYFLSGILSTDEHRQPHTGFDITTIFRHELAGNSLLHSALMDCARYSVLQDYARVKYDSICSTLAAG